MNIEAVKQLRERTYLSMSVCKKALEQVSGDVDKAVELLQKQNVVKTVDPLVVPQEGVVQAKIVDNVGRIAEINCQTDFAAKSEIFLSFVDKFLDSDLDREDLVAANFAKTDRGQLLCRQLGEKVVIKRAESLWIDKVSKDINIAELDTGACRKYNHHSGKIAVLLGAVVEQRFAENAKLLAFLDDCAMQVAATHPLIVSLDSGEIVKITDQLSAQRAIFEEQVQDKPEKMRAKIVAGKLESWYRDVVLLKQESIVHAKKTLETLQEELQKELGSKFLVTDFTRYELGA